MLGFVRQMRAAIFHLRDLRIGIVGVRPVCAHHGRVEPVTQAFDEAVAHVVRDKVEVAYARSDLLARRRQLMNESQELGGVGPISGGP